MKTLFKILFGVSIFLTLLSLEITQPIIIKKRVDATIPLDVQSIKDHVVNLCEIEGYRKYDNLKGLNEAADYILKEFSEKGNKAFFQEYMADGNTYKNVIAQYGNPEGKQLIVGAHYDVCGEQMGADDNASGVAGLLALDYLLDSLSPSLDYGIQMVAYSLEEPPYFRTKQMGSYIHAASIQEKGQEVIGMICLEMIGFFSEEKKSQEYPVGAMKLLYPSKGNYIAVVSNYSNKSFTRKVKRKMKQIGEVPVRSVTAPSFVPGIDFSDHQNYWEFNYPAVMITNTAFYRNKHYHQTSDKPETLDYTKMGEVIKSVYWTITNM